MLKRHITEDNNDSISTDYLSMLNENYSILELLRNRLASGKASGYNFNQKVIEALYHDTMDDIFLFQCEWNLSFRLWYDGFKADKKNREEILRDGLESVQLAYQNMYPSIVEIMRQSSSISRHINLKIDIINEYFSVSKFNFLKRRKILSRFFYRSVG
jgi:hypothetical protein